MAYGTPTDPVAGTVITVAYAVANILDPIRWLRQLTGNADPPGSNYVVVSSSTTGTAWSKIPTDAINNGAITNAKISDDTITSAKMAAATPDRVLATSATGDPDYRQINSNMLEGNVINSAGYLVDGVVTNAKLAGGIDASTKLSDSSITAAKLASDAVETAKIKDLNVTTGKLADLAVTAAKIAANTITSSQIANNTIGNSQLVGGTAVDNLGFTPSRIVSGTYSGNGATTARQITTGFAVKLVIIHQPSADVMYVTINTTSSLRLGPSPTFVQGSASVHTHASNGFVVSDGSVQGNVSGADNYSYTAFG